MDGKTRMPTGYTVRQELVLSAIADLRRSERTGNDRTDAHNALESAVAGGVTGTIGGAMLEYYRGISDAALEHLICDVIKGA